MSPAVLRPGLEAIRAEHELGPDRLRCGCCGAPYPCGPRWHADEVLDELDELDN